jgi:hypothetical protein
VTSVWVRSAPSDGSGEAYDVTLWFAAPEVNVVMRPGTPPTTASAYLSTLRTQMEAGTVASVDGTPVWTVPASQSVDGDTHLAFYAHGLYIQVVGEGDSSTAAPIAQSIIDRYATTQPE